MNDHLHDTLHAVQHDCYEIDLLRQLVAHNTVNDPGNEEPLAHYIVSELEPLGFTTQLVPCGPNRSSVVAFKGNPAGRKLMFNGHLDVVPVSQNWATDPFVLTQEGDRLYGRGTADMKGGIASMIAAARKAIKEGVDFSHGQLILTFVADEEIYNKGTHSVLAMPEVRAADFAVIGEPTELEICVGHRGTVREVIRVNGTPCHSSKPAEGVNAISQMSHVIQAIDAHHEVLKAVKHPILPSPSIAVVMIEGGEKDNIIPGHCDIRFDRRTLPAETQEDIHTEITALLDSVAARVPDFSYELTPYIYLAAGEVSPASEIVEKAVVAYQHVFGKQAVLRDFTATCEQSLFMHAGIDSLIFGPGSIQQAHVDNEYTTVSQLQAATAFYHALLKEFFA